MLIFGQYCKLFIRQENVYFNELHIVLDTFTSFRLVFTSKPDTYDGSIVFL